ncbi:MAG: AAA family ATPase [Gammaproteobacteria bacterium]|nr:AAA family ATPase [Gammaproteobacteria bacterium]
MELSKFVGRKRDLGILSKFIKKKTASLLVIKGRRRIGKSRLVEEFAAKHKIKLLSLEGLYPESGITAQHQRNEFASQMGFSGLVTKDWSDLFRTLADRVQKGRVVVLLDEISWMAYGDQTFLPKLKNAWDLYFKKNNQLLLIVCGSASSWIEKNMLSSTGFVGRISFVMTLEELQLKECREFWGVNISPVEILKILSVTGGVPKYLEEINPHRSAEDNIKDLCFTKGGLLFKEFDNIFNSSFMRKSNMYEKIVRSLSDGAKEATELCKALNTELTGRFSEYLSELELAGFIKRDYTWKLDTGLDAKLSKYRVSDNYVRFYLKYIYKFRTKIMRDSFEVKALSSLPGWDSIMGLQFESLVLNNRGAVLKLLGIRAEEVVSENPYFQHGTKNHKNCQIDYMIQTKSRSLYICEIKFSKNIIGPSIVKEVQKKVDALSKVKGVSYRPVLIHAGEVAVSVSESDYFVKIIDFSEFAV